MEILDRQPSNVRRRYINSMVRVRLHDCGQNILKTHNKRGACNNLANLKTHLLHILTRSPFINFSNNGVASYVRRSFFRTHDCMDRIKTQLLALSYALLLFDEVNTS